ncbi:MAG TPA: amino acid racemase [Steroidobacteraceae bacterium]|jgi:aspartate racemase|nr:amino acid racemase [Steroidobacteraceae bacterium]
MPRILPPGGAVDWPADEGVLGVVGVAPWATLDFARALYRQVDASKDWHYPRLLLDINTKLPSRGRHLQLGETDPSPAIAATIEELARQGATLAVVVCNTAHILFERWAAGSPIPLLHIIEETTRHAGDCGARNIAALASASLAEHDLYGKSAGRRGIGSTRIDATDQALVNRFIEAIKVSGKLDAEQLRDAGSLLVKLRAREVDTVVAGCTELSVLESTAREAGLRFVDSNAALARAALIRLGVSAEKLRPF